MKQSGLVIKDIVRNSLDLIVKRITLLGQSISIETDPYSMHYFIKEQQNCFELKRKIEKRFKVKHSVTYVDFTNKRKVA